MSVEPHLNPLITSCPQIGSTAIALFGFNGYDFPPDGVDNGVFAVLSGGGNIPFYKNRLVPLAGTESVYTSSILACT